MLNSLGKLKTRQHDANHGCRTGQVGVPVPRRPAFLGAACPARHNEELKRRHKKTACSGHVPGNYRDANLSALDFASAQLD